MTDSRYRWLIVGYTLIIQAVSLGILIYCFALFALPWLDEFGAPRRDVMLTIALLQISTSLVSPFVGRAIDRYPIRRIILLGLAMMGAGLVLASKAQSLWQLQILYATLFPFSVALMSTMVSQTLIARWFADKRSLALGLSATGTNLGGILFPLFVVNWLTLFGWRETLVWLALLSLALIIPLTWLVLRRSPPEMSSLALDSMDARVWSTREILTTSRFWIPVLCMLPLTAGFSAAHFNLGAYGRDLGFDLDTVGMLLALSSLCMILGKFLFGGLGDRVDHRKLYWLAAASMAVAMLLLQDEPSLAVLAIGVVFLGLAGGGILPLQGVIIASRFGVTSFGRVMGFVMLGVLFSGMGPLLAGWAYDLTGTYDSAFLILMASLLPASVAMRYLPEVNAKAP